MRSDSKIVLDISLELHQVAISKFFLSSFVGMWLKVIILVIISLPLFCSQTTYSCDRSSACGCSSNPAIVSKIFGGQASQSNSWGWAVGIILNNTYFCAGTLVSSTWIVTSYRCIGVYRAWEITVSLATNSLSGFKQWRYATAVYRHPGFSSTNYINDLGLIQVTPPFNMTDPGIAIICLPDATTSDYPPNSSTVGRCFVYRQRSSVSVSYLACRCWMGNTKYWWFFVIVIAASFI